MSGSHQISKKLQYLGSDVDNGTIVLRCKKGRSGVNAPPRHVHCTDWREMMALTDNLEMRKSDMDLPEIERRALQTHPHHHHSNSSKAVASTSLGSLPNTAVSSPTTRQHLRQQVLENAEKVERLARLRYASGGSVGFSRASIYWWQQVFYYIIRYFSFPRYWLGF